MGRSKRSEAAGPSDRQLRIEAAALELFSLQGFSGTSTRQIAQAAAVAEGTIFRYFPTKKSLLHRLVKPFAQDVIAPLATRNLQDLLEAEYESLYEFLRALYSDRVRLARAHPRLTRVLLQELSLHAELRETVQALFVNRAFPLFVAAFDRLRARGQLRDDVGDTQVIRLILSCFVGSIAFAKPDEPIDLSAVRVLAAGLAVPTTP